MSFDRVVNSVRKLLVGSYRPPRYESPFAAQSRAFEIARTIVPVYYWATLFVVSDTVSREFRKIEVTLPADLLWPVQWAGVVGVATATYIVCLGATIVAIASAVFPSKRVFRIAASVALLQLFAFVNSTGHLGHFSHAWLFASLFFCIIPDHDHRRWRLENSSRGFRYSYLAGFAGAQAMVFLTYSMSGILKSVVGLYEWTTGQSHSFHPYALAMQILEKIENTGQVPILASVILDRPLLGWPMQLSVIYLEAFAIVAAFRPTLHRFWGISLALFHVGSVFIMNITFSMNVLLLGLLFAFSPFSPRRTTIRDIALSLPVFGWVARRIRPQLAQPAAARHGSDA